MFNILVILSNMEKPASVSFDRKVPLCLINIYKYQEYHEESFFFSPLLIPKLLPQQVFEITSIVEERAFDRIKENFFPLRQYYYF